MISVSFSWVCSVSERPHNLSVFPPEWVSTLANVNLHNTEQKQAEKKKEGAREKTISIAGKTAATKHTTCENVATAKKSEIAELTQITHTHGVDGFGSVLFLLSLFVCLLGRGGRVPPPPSLPPPRPTTTESGALRWEWQLCVPPSLPSTPSFMLLKKRDSCYEERWAPLASRLRSPSWMRNTT